MICDQIKDQIGGAEMSINVHEDQIKNFLKKLNFNKADLMQIAEKLENRVDKKLDSFESKFAEFEEGIMTNANSTVELKAEEHSLDTSIIG